MSILRGRDVAARRARLESPRPNYATSSPSAGSIRAPRERQLPTNHGHAALPLGVIRAYQSDSSSPPPARSAPSPPQESRARSRLPRVLTPVLPYQLATSRTTTGRVLTSRSTRMRPRAGELSGRNSAESSRFGKSVASTIAMFDGPPDPAEPVRDVQSRPFVRLLAAPRPNALHRSVVAHRTCWAPLLSTVSQRPWPVAQASAVVN